MDYEVNESGMPTYELIVLVSNDFLSFQIGLR